MQTVKERLKLYLQNKVTIWEDQPNAILDLFTFKLIRRNTVLLSAGKIAKEVYFVSNGGIRNYYYSKDGK